MPSMPTNPVVLAVGVDMFVLVETEVLEVIERWTERGHASREAGGILIGSYRGDHIQVTDCTSPLAADRRSRFRFHRRDHGHQAAAFRAWTASGGTDTFVGEWHTHPELIPTPSQLDLRTWTAITSRSIHPFIFAVGGWNSISWFRGQGKAITAASIL
jgi:integrative and conjugative element protein (TIGR02256 family)